MVICPDRGANDLHSLADAIVTSSTEESRMVYLSFWYRPTQAVVEKRPLKECCCCCVFMQVWDHFVNEHIGRVASQTLAIM